MRGIRMGEFLWIRRPFWSPIYWYSATHSQNSLYELISQNDCACKMDNSITLEQHNMHDMVNTTHLIALIFLITHIKPALAEDQNELREDRKHFNPVLISSA